MENEDTSVYPQGSPQSMGLFKRGQKKAAPRLLSAAEEMQYASSPGGRLSQMAADRLGQALKPMQPDAYKQKRPGKKEMM